MDDKAIGTFRAIVLSISFVVLGYHMISIIYLAQTPIQHQILSLGTMILVL